jgi:putative methyltransferase (TIGR04325 family)
MSLINRLAAVGPLRQFAQGAIDRLPFSLRRIVRSVVRDGVLQPPPFKGVYARFEDVAAAYPSAASAEAFARSGLSLKREEAAGLVVLSRSHAFLPLAVATSAAPDRPTRILDFGGSGGIDYLYLRETVGAAVEYCIVEVPDVCAAGRKLWPNEPQLVFTETLPAEGAFDIVYSWSAIQYVPDPLGLLRQFARYKPKIIMVLQTPFARHAFVRAQVLTGTRMPHWVLSLPDAEQVMREAGYRLAMRATNEIAMNVDNYDRDHRVAHMADLVFVREPDAAASAPARGRARPIA